ncbi:alpha/beta fold hydrolase [Rheinheimera mesophila]|mgnify:CR=1 FL=1|jgi:esterase|uniref:Alpha/beta fold hydrolase n=1 Tax=Rheinheimera mesophila TaxID=1547515 RepID=A0A3P3QQD3_9GAMM|nr:alpha/beta fold hydrolase [Rheinheimera mesophila]KKL00176.1 acyl-CoA esterase [Rheinheimera mesophila]RRJ22670.1 alpha/beta fold hydrolase [Rheinheimera mesophila]
MILHTEITGQGQAIVLIHGLFGSYENLGVIARALAGQWQVINLDMRNHGRSGWHDSMSYALMAEDVKETLDHLGLEQVMLLGHSMGGKIAMEFALRYPDRVNKLILADISPVQNKPRHLEILSALDGIELDNLQSRQQADQQLALSVTETGVRQFLLKSLYKEGERFRWRFNVKALIANYPQLLAAPSSKGPYPGPTLFIKGAESDYLLPEHQHQIQQLFPHSKAKVIMGTGHWLHAEKPVAFAKIVTDFLLS